jgi:hypothetical protein
MTAPFGVRDYKEGLPLGVVRLAASSATKSSPDARRAGTLNRCRPFDPS